LAHIDSFNEKSPAIHYNLLKKSVQRNRTMQRLIIVFAGSLLLMTVTLAVARRTDPQPAWIAFISDHNGQTDIWRMRTDGTDLQQLTDTPIREHALAWSPDSSQIVFNAKIHPQTSLRTLHILSVNSGETRTLAVDPGDYDAPHWSPDGSQILYSARDIEENRRLYNISMTGEYGIIDTSLVPSYAPKWSGDGEWIVFSGAQNNGRLNLYRMRPDGSQLEQLLKTEDNDSQPVFSPDGNSLVYVRFREAKSELFRLDITTGTTQNLTLSDAYSLNPSWSADDEWIVYASNRSRDYEIWRVRPDGTDTQRLTNRPSEDTYPAFSPIVDQDWGSMWLAAVWLGAVLTSLRRLMA
jgi:Tol biopolymer transport system component